MSWNEWTKFSNVSFKEDLPIVRLPITEEERMVLVHLCYDQYLNIYAYQRFLQTLDETI